MVEGQKFAIHYPYCIYVCILIDLTEVGHLPDVVIWPTSSTVYVCIATELVHEVNVMKCRYVCSRSYMGSSLNVGWLLPAINLIRFYKTSLSSDVTGHWRSPKK